MMRANDLIIQSIRTRFDGVYSSIVLSLTASYHRFINRLNKSGYILYDIPHTKNLALRLVKSKSRDER